MTTKNQINANEHDYKNDSCDDKSDDDHDNIKISILMTIITIITMMNATITKHYY